VPYVVIATPSAVVTPMAQALQEEGRTERPEEGSTAPVAAAG
jgi:hypothetical protein